jgi:hypothetical protein
MDTLKGPSVLIKIALVLYIVLGAPRLTPTVARYFHHPMVQVLLLALVVYASTQDIGTGILIAIAFLVSYNSYTKDAISKLASNTKKLFVATNKEDDMSSVVTMGDCKISTEEPLNCKTFSSDAIKLAKVIGHDQEMSVELGLKKDSDWINSEISDAALLDPYKRSMVPVKDMPGYSF